MPGEFAIAGPALRKRAIIATNNIYQDVKAGRVFLNASEPGEERTVSVNVREWLGDTQRRLSALMRLDDVLRGQGL